jgi:hypothetical protein
MRTTIEATAGESERGALAAASARATVVMITARTITEEAALHARAAWGAITVAMIMAALMSAPIM